MEDRRREKGSGIGKSRGEGGMNKESPIREGEREKRREWKLREMQRDGKSGREKPTEGEKPRGE